MRTVAVADRQPLPFEKWPLWAKGIYLLRKDGDIGVGDTVYREIGPTASKAFQAFYFSVYGKSCGCARRHADWNIQYPYPKP